MANHADHNDGHGAPVPREVSHPVLWAAGLFASTAALAGLFFHQIDAGRAAARGEPKIVTHAAGGGEPDHAALIADNGQAVMDRGELLYGKNCASCHGPKGDTNPNNTVPVPRNFRTEAFKNNLGSGPFAFYKVLSEGYGASMPAFKNLEPKDRYAIAHFVRETMMKGGNPGFAAKDSAAALAKVPAAGAAEGGAADVAPNRVAPPELLPELLAAWSHDDLQQRAATAAWLTAARQGAPAELAETLDRVVAMAAAQPGRADALRAAAKLGQYEVFTRLLVENAGAGGADPRFTLMPASHLQALYARLADAARAGAAH